MSSFALFMLCSSVPQGMLCNFVIGVTMAKVQFEPLAATYPFEVAVSLIHNLDVSVLIVSYLNSAVNSIIPSIYVVYNAKNSDQPMCKRNLRAVVAFLYS